jgi:perosamine synthetase
MLGNEARYLLECVETNWVSSRGPFVDRFEQEVARLCGRRHAVACVNGTAALHVTLLAAGVGADDEVLVSDLTFIASANAVRHCGAWPVLIDCEPRYWQLDVEKAADFLRRDCAAHDGVLRNRRTGRRVRAILPVHILGHPVDMAPLVEVADRFGLVVVADAAEALGAEYRGRPAAAFGTAAVLSFNGNKIATAGGGGAVVTDDDRLAERVRYLTTQARDDEVEFVHRAVGFNYRLTNVQAALAVAQLERLDERLASKRATAARYREALAALPLELPEEASWARSAWWLYTVLVDEARFGLSRRDLLAQLARDGIEARPLWTPVSRQPAYAGCQAYACDHSAAIQARSLSLPSSVGLERGDVEYVTGAIAAAHAVAS